MLIKTLLSLPAALAAAVALGAPALADDDTPAPWVQRLAAREAVDPTTYEKCWTPNGADEQRCVIQFKTLGSEGGYFCRMVDPEQSVQCVSLATKGRDLGNSASIHHGQKVTAGTDDAEANGGFRPDSAELADTPVLPDEHKIAFTDRDDAEQLVCWAEGEWVGCADQLDQQFALSPHGSDSGGHDPALTTDPQHE